MHSSPLIIIVGPTGVGKSDCALQLAYYCKGEIINGDMGQFYTPLSLGTAKPDWKREKVPHHLFDILNEPQDFSSLMFRRRAEQSIIECSARASLPIIVGGSLFYNKALIFKPHGNKNAIRNISVVAEQQESTSLWEKLLTIDPQRAQALHPHDTYRIERALDLYKESGNLPSVYSPICDPLSKNILIIHITREREELYDRIDRRVHLMLDAGWMDEVRDLSEQWKTWLCAKKIIGYDDLIQEIQAGKDRPSDSCIKSIQQRSRNYAKRQLTFWRSYSRQLEQVLPGSILEINLTLQPFDLYLKIIFERLRAQGIMCDLT